MLLAQLAPGNAKAIDRASFRQPVGIPVEQVRQRGSFSAALVEKGLVDVEENDHLRHVGAATKSGICLSDERVDSAITQQAL